MSDAKQLTDDPVKADIDVQQHLKSDEPLHTMTAAKFPSEAGRQRDANA